MTTEQLVIAACLMALTAAVHSSVGFGANLLAGPLLVLVSPDFVPGPIVLTGVVINLVVMWREPPAPDIEPEHHPWSRLRWPIVGLPLGSILGALTVAAVPKDDLAVLVAVLVLLAVSLVASGLRLPHTRASLTATGAASGYLSATAAIGGPPIALAFVDEDGPAFRRTMSRFLMVSAAFSVVTLTAVGELHWSDVGIALALLPGVAVGLVVGGILRPHVDAGRLRPAVLGVVAASASLVLLRSVLG